MSAFAHIQDVTLNASVTDEKIGFGVSPKPSSIYISGIYHGDKETFTDKVALSARSQHGAEGSVD